MIVAVIHNNHRINYKQVAMQNNTYTTEHNKPTESS